MSSVVNKSKNKFIPKARAKARPRPATTTTESASPPTNSLGLADAAPVTYTPQADTSRPDQGLLDAVRVPTKSPFADGSHDDSEPYDQSAAPDQEESSERAVTYARNAPGEPEVERIVIGSGQKALGTSASTVPNAKWLGPERVGPGLGRVAVKPRVSDSIIRSEREDIQRIVIPTNSEIDGKGGLWKPLVSQKEHAGTKSANFVLDTKKPLKKTASKSSNRALRAESSEGTGSEDGSCFTDAGQGDDEVIRESSTAGKKSTRAPKIKSGASRSLRTTRKVATPRVDTEEEEGGVDILIAREGDDSADQDFGDEVVENHSPKIRAKRAKRKSSVTDNRTSKRRIMSDNDLDSGIHSEDAPRKKGKPKKRAPRKLRQPRKIKARSESPENGEDEEIDPANMKMGELCSDPRIGRKSKRFIELANVDWAKEKAKARGFKLDVNAGNGDANENDVEEETPDQRLLRLAEEREDRMARQVDMSGPQLRLVNGELVLDEESLAISRHIVDESNMEVIEETELNRLVNSTTYSKKELITKRWSKLETEKFYEGLSMFGTDFEMIARLFPSRTRRQIKNKFNAEERRDEKRITGAIKNRVEVDIDEYAETAGMEVGGGMKDIEGELELIRREHREEETRIKDNAAAAEKERQERVNREMMESEGGLSFAPMDKPKRRSKKTDRSDEIVVGESVEEYLRQQKEIEEERLW